jgi:hypothetical protein
VVAVVPAAVGTSGNNGHVFDGTEAQGSDFCYCYYYET